MLGNLFWEPLGTALRTLRGNLAWEPFRGNLGNLWEPGLGTLLGREPLGTLLGNLAWEPFLLENLAWEPGLGTLLGNLFLGTFLGNLAQCGLGCSDLLRDLCNG